FKDETIQRWLGHFQTLLEAVINDPRQNLRELPLLSPAERQQLLMDWNNTKTNYPQDQCIHQLFEAQVERTPDAIAVVFENQQLTYTELNGRANQLAHYLQSFGVGPEVVVGISVERSLEMIVGLLGILKAGGAYLPLDPDYPNERLQFMLEDSQVSLLLTQQHLLASFPQSSETATPKIICLDSDYQIISQAKNVNPESSVTTSNLAYVIYTSGSTGKPKGVMNNHVAISNKLLWVQDTYPLTTEDCILQKTPFSFDVSVWELFCPLLNGARLVFAKPNGHKDASYLVNLIQEQQVTTLHFVSSMLQLFLTEKDVEKCNSLKRVICSGEALSLELQERFFARLVCELHNLYGPTEAAIHVTFWQCQSDSNLKTVPIGRPIANIQIYILDSHLQPVPIGVIGELHIGGVGLARGYLNKPELTAEKFIPNPFASLDPPLTPLDKGGEQPSKLYKTGDLARYLPDGKIEYLGRIDNQVKVRGFRLELGEIEAVLSQHPLVQEAVVIARADQASDHDYDQLNTNLVAYLVPALKGQVLPEQLAQWQSEYVSDWQKIYEESYSKPQPQIEDPTFNISGWNSSYTGQAIPAAEMQEWVDQTVSRILGNQPPQRVLEIGCGSGLLLFRVAKHCQEYWGADYSAATINNLEHLCSTIEGLEGKVKLLHRTADDFTGIPQATFDRVVINSVVQYFPSVDYLLQVIAGAVKTIADQGKIFLGDIRSLSLLEPYHAAVQLARTEANKTLEEWQKQVNQSVATEEELLIAPQFFIALKQRFPRISWVEIAPKRGQADNELTQFRYDVTLHLDTDGQKTTIPWLNWQRDRFSLAQLQDKLKLEQPEYLGIRDVPNQRLQKALQILDCLENPPGVKTVGELRQLLAKNSGIGINPEQMWQLGEQLGYTVHLSWWEGSQDGSFDVVFCRQNAILEPII
ncbi:MAG: amino acid adenylation domain-containing protein, partial [Microcystis sp.]|uniref:amino acid adenylation domain-containing protein n=1 Tax=Microcystis sp. TaxID=1127 RepID=UPI00391D59A8